MRTEYFLNMLSACNINNAGLKSIYYFPCDNTEFWQLFKFLWQALGLAVGSSVLLILFRHLMNALRHYNRA